jgi:hypothetical protein
MNEIAMYFGRIGIALATTISWSIHKSILWAILQGMCGWFYILYYVCMR